MERDEKVRLVVIAKSSRSADWNLPKVCVPWVTALSALTLKRISGSPALELHR